MPNPHDSEMPAPLPEQESRPVDLSRRKLGVGVGLSAVFTLASRPVLAGQCMTPSSAASGNLSTHGTPPTCTGLTPAQWVTLAQTTTPNSPNNPNNGFPGGNVKFHDVFAPGTRANWGTNTRLYEVMLAADNANTGNHPNPISKEFAAALLNIRGGYVPANVLTEMQLIGMWNDWLPDGLFNPMAGVDWDAAKIVDYLRTLQA